MAVALFRDKQDCCGCGACMNACSRNAIDMVEDEYGFVYPRINAERCIGCGACLTACGYQDSPQKTDPFLCYAAAAKDETLLKSSSSGGVFAVLASQVIEHGGAVYGVAMPLDKSGFYPRHQRIERQEDLALLQGSKYIQSDTMFTFRQAQEDLQKGREVLFSGTPCQIAGLLKYLGRKYDNLLTAEVICHGVPSRKIFLDYISELETRESRSVTQFFFRTKENGHGIRSAVCLKDGKGNANRIIKDGYALSYVFYFLRSCIYRESCYSCPFATGDRVADLTLGDYWGFHQEHPEVSPRKQISNGNGVSCVLVNTEKGREAVDSAKGAFELVETKFEKIARHNGQLCRPSRCGAERKTLLELYRENGYPALESYFQNTYRRERIIRMAASVVPQNVRQGISRVVGWLKRGLK